ncbi:hypothetical protein N7456_009151 [Penicillium angulare]|uniref:Glycosyl transferase, family 8 n=1 Tax=Penicillium angulare TaxID=116970 RepID=A0A9W9F450_9EURO|nr:hypothetical protein N7456_009151 [Penicillium angulare]
MPEAKGSKVWTTLITNTEYLSGLLTLDYSLKKVGSKYPLLVLYTDSFDGHKALESRGIAKRHVPYLHPTSQKDYTNDVRFYDCWSKLTPFSLIEYDRVVQLDSDMLVLKNMDELMDVPLDAAELNGAGPRVFAASPACVCNPLKKSHYPKDWIPENCAYTTQHDSPNTAQVAGPSASAGLGMPNGGLQVVIPSQGTYDKIIEHLSSSVTSEYDFADQSLLGDVFNGRWVPLPYTYNALKTLRWKGVHDTIWRDESVKNVHYILSPKPWDEKTDVQGQDPSHAWWKSLNTERLAEEQQRGITDGF